MCAVCPYQGLSHPRFPAICCFKKTFCLMKVRPQDLLSHEPTLWSRRTIFLGPTKSHKVLGKCHLISKLLSCEYQLPRLRDEILRVKNDIRPILFQVLPTKRHATSGVITVAVPFNPREIRTSLDACCCPGLTYLVCYYSRVQPLASGGHCKCKPGYIVKRLAEQDKKLDSIVTRLDNQNKMLTEIHPKISKVI